MYHLSGVTPQSHCTPPLLSMLESSFSHCTDHCSIGCGSMAEDAWKKKNTYRRGLLVQRPFSSSQGAGHVSFIESRKQISFTCSSWLTQYLTGSFLRSGCLIFTKFYLLSVDSMSPKSSLAVAKIHSCYRKDSYAIAKAPCKRIQPIVGQQHTTTCNRMCKRTQHVGNIQQSFVRLHVS